MKKIIIVLVATISIITARAQFSFTSDGYTVTMDKKPIISGTTQQGNKMELYPIVTDGLYMQYTVMYSGADITMVIMDQIELTNLQKVSTSKIEEKGEKFMIQLNPKDGKNWTVFRYMVGETEQSTSTQSVTVASKNRSDLESLIGEMNE